MTTRFYLPRDSTYRKAPVTHTFSALWNGGAATAQRFLLARTGSTAGNYQVANNSSTAETSATAVDYRVAGYVSNGIPTARTIDGTFKFAVRCNVTAAGAAARLRARVAVVSHDGTVVRGESLWMMGGTDLPVGDSLGAGAEIRTITGNLTAVAAQAGDRVVVEIGVYFGNTDTTSRQAYFWLGDDAGASDAAFVEGAAPTLVRAWVEFSNDFLTPPATPGSAAALVNHTFPTEEMLVGNYLLDRPSGTQVGDLIVIAGRLRQNTALPTFPSGFQVIADSGVVGTSTGAMRNFMAAKVATAVEVSTAMLVIPGSGYQQWQVFSFRNAQVAATSGTAPADASTSTSNRPHPQPAITNPGAAIVGAVALLFESCHQPMAVPPWLNADGSTATLTHPNDSVAAKHATRVLTGINVAAGGTYDPPDLYHRNTSTNGHNYVTTAALIAVAPPATPTNVVATATGEHSGTVTWDAVSNATSYEVRVNGGAPIAVAGTSYDLTGLGTGTAYNIEVRSLGDGGTSSWTAPVTLTTLPAPDAPYTITVTTTGEHTGTIAWEAIPRATAYELRVDGGAPFTVTSPHDLTGLATGTAYTLELRSVGDGSYSGWSGPRTLTTLGPPAPPSVVTVTATGERTGTVTWEPVDRATGYEVSVDGGAPIPATSPLELTGLLPNTSYAIEVRSLGDGSVGAWSAPYTLTTNNVDPTVAPPVSDPTRRVYDALPEVYRAADAAVGGFPLLRYLAVLLDQLRPIDDLLTRNAGETLSGDVDLVDPARADAGWLRWLAQLLGVDVTGLTVAEQRTALADPSTAWDHGTPGALVDAAAKGLTGTKAVEVTAHYTGDPFLIGIGTIAAETTQADTFGELEAIAPKWADLEALGTFANAKAPAPVRAAEAERPAGYRLAHHYTA